MILRNYLAASALLILISGISVEASSVITPPAITPEMKKNAETAIKYCERAYENTKKLRNKFDQLKKPGSFSSQKKKDTYENLNVNKRAFDIQLSEFTRFTNNEKINIRTAKSVSKLRDKVVAYSSNCSRFASGLEGFVKWATNKEGPAGYESIYKDWQNDARKQLEDENPTSQVSAPSS
jgi:hypothetical protein